MPCAARPADRAAGSEAVRASEKGMDSSLTSKSGSSGVSPMTQRKTPFAVASIRVLILSMCAALLLSIGSQRLKALPAGSDIAGRRAHFDQIWASCGGDSACCATHFSPPARPHRVVRAAVRTADKHQVRWRMALHAKSSDGADIVSEMIFFHLSWEANKTRNILTALNIHPCRGVLWHARRRRRAFLGEYRAAIPLSLSRAARGA